MSEAKETDLVRTYQMHTYIPGIHRKLVGNWLAKSSAAVRVEAERLGRRFLNNFTSFAFLNGKVAETHQVRPFIIEERFVLYKTPDFPGAFFFQKWGMICQRSRFFFPLLNKLPKLSFQEISLFFFFFFFFLQGQEENQGGSYSVITALFRVNFYAVVGWRSIHSLFYCFISLKNLYQYVT